MATSYFGGRSTYLLVGAIDFGTAYSGWAYSFYHDFKKDPTKGWVKTWHSGSGTLATEKTPTVVLIKPDGRTLEAFGYDAENRYRDLTDRGEHPDYYYFRKFKVMLHKQLSEAGIARHKLSIALEPEAASIFCRHLTIDKIIGHTSKVSSSSFPVGTRHMIPTSKRSITSFPVTARPRSDVSISSFATGTRYMILDAGGGTIDITIHEVTDSGGVKEITAASGGGWGGTVVDQAFQDLMTDLVGRKVLSKIQTGPNRRLA